MHLRSEERRILEHIPRENNDSRTRAYGTEAF